jgi:hypothetical protein
MRIVVSAVLFVALLCSQSYAQNAAQMQARDNAHAVVGELETQEGEVQDLAGDVISARADALADRALCTDPLMLIAGDLEYQDGQSDVNASQPKAVAGSTSTAEVALRVADGDELWQNGNFAAAVEKYNSIGAEAIVAAQNWDACASFLDDAYGHFLLADVYYAQGFMP